LLGSAYGKVSIDGSGVQSGIATASKSLKDFGELGGQIGSKLQDLGGKMTLGLTVPILAFGALAVKEAATTEAVLADLNAVIKSTGGKAGVSADSVTKYADKMQLLTKFSDDQIISGNAMLLTFTNIGKKVFPQASDATLDLAQKFGMDLSQASILLGKALNDPIAGVGALRRIGVQLNDEQEKQIKHFMAINDIASAQKIILGELKTEVGGVAEAYGKTFAGQLFIFNNRLDDMKEKIGIQLIPSLIRFMDAAQPLLDWFANASPQTIDFIISLAGLAAIAGPVTTGIGTIVKVLAFFSPAGGGGVMVSWIGTSLIPSLAGIGGSALSLLGSILLLAAGPAILYLAFKNNFMGITDTFNQLVFIIKYYSGKIMDAFKNINWGALGKSMMWALANGLLLGIPSIVVAAAKAGAAALQAMRTALDSHSPSKKMEKIGKDSAQGYSDGLTNGLSAMRKDVKSQLNIQLDFFRMYSKAYGNDVEKTNKKNTQVHVQAIKTQTSATIQGLAIQAAALQKYKAAAAAFWSGMGIPMANASQNLNNSAQSASPYMEQITKPGWTPSVMMEQLKPINVEQTNPVKVEIIQNFSSGVTVHQAEQMINKNTASIYKALNKSLGGAA
jgi:hypothetical protein